MFKINNQTYGNSHENTNLDTHAKEYIYTYKYMKHCKPEPKSVYVCVCVCKYKYMQHYEPDTSF